MSDITELADRLEMLAEWDRGYDAEIALAVDGGEIIWRMANGTMEQYPVRRYESTSHIGGFGNAPVPRYTASLDDALSIVPVGFHTHYSSQDRHSYRWTWHLRGGFGVNAKALAASAPLAIVVAALRARAALGDQP